MLKNILVAIFAFGLGLNLVAQEKGQLLIGGGLYFNSQNDVSNGITTKSRLFSLSPSFGLMVSKNIATGVLLDYQIQSTEQSDANFSTTSEQFSMFIGAFGRYHGRFTDKILYTAQLQFGKNFLLRDVSVNKLESFAAGGNVGLLYFVAKRAALGLQVISINYVMEKDVDIDLDRSTFTIDYNIFNPRFQVVYYL